jgi:hypothetical protein
LNKLYWKVYQQGPAQELSNAPKGKGTRIMMEERTRNAFKKCTLLIVVNTFPTIRTKTVLKWLMDSGLKVNIANTDLTLFLYFK